MGGWNYYQGCDRSVVSHKMRIVVLGEVGEREAGSGPPTLSRGLTSASGRTLRVGW